MAEAKIFENLRELQGAYQEFHNSEPDGQFNLRSFALWLYHRETAVQSPPNERLAGGKGTQSLFHGGIDDQISHIFLDMHKLIKFYIKKALDGTDLVGVDDLHFLMTLAVTESMTKSEIINSHISEMSSGTEVIKRLLKRGLIEEFDDPDDKRSMRVRISAEGLGKVTGISSKLHRLHRLFLGMISPEDKITLLAIIGKVHSFHVHIFNDERNTSLEELFSKYLQGR
jgi:MarR family transcriptional regulator, lower aerobic nicotinate degradation pathway regulator